jgi:acyl CoA:acetate/3-ketoacid CoA transferase beta subunit
LIHGTDLGQWLAERRAESCLRIAERYAVDHLGAARDAEQRVDPLRDHRMQRRSRLPDARRTGGELQGLHGLIDCVILGAYQVDQTRTFANWKISLDLPTGLGNTIGGAMDLAQCAKRVFVMLEHTTNEGRPRLVRHCTLPSTALHVVKLVVTDLGVFAVTEQGFELQRHAPGYTVEEIQALTDAPLRVSPDLCPAL